MSISTPTATLPCLFSFLSDDIVLNILAKLEPDPRDWARLSCVSHRLLLLVRTVCCRSRCARTLPADLFTPNSPDSPFHHLHKLSVCCPGLRSAGVLLEHSDFGLERDIGPHLVSPHANSTQIRRSPDSAALTVATADPSWSLFDDLYFDTVYDRSESADAHSTSQNAVIHDDHHNIASNAGIHAGVQGSSDQSPFQNPNLCVNHHNIISNERPSSCQNHVGPAERASSNSQSQNPESSSSSSTSSSRRRRGMRKRSSGPVGAHLATGPWTLSREQGNKLLASRFRGDCLYICDWPGCVHAEEKRKYMLFRGIFKDFRRSRVWKSIADLNRGKIEVDCAFCECKETWDLHSAFCLRRVFGFHDDGEPVVRAYVCENGHVSGAWTERPLYA